MDARRKNARALRKILPLLLLQLPQQKGPRTMSYAIKFILALIYTSRIEVILNAGSDVSVLINRKRLLHAYAQGRDKNGQTQRQIQQHSPHYA